MYSSVQAAISARPAFLCLDELQKLQEVAWRAPMRWQAVSTILVWGLFFFWHFWVKFKKWVTGIQDTGRCCS